MSTVIALALSASALAGPAFSEPAFATPALLTPGLHMEADVGMTADQVEDGGWFGLVREAEGYALRRAIVRAGTLTHPLGGPDDAALRITTNLEAPVLFLVRGVGSLRAGPVPAAYAGGRTLVPGSWQVVGFAPDGFMVLAAEDADGIEDPELVDLRSPTHLSLHRYAVSDSGRPDERPSQSQALGMVPREAHLLWAGDLDGDGHPDLILDQTTGSGATEAQLLLSTLAPPDGLVGEAAVLTTTGC
jgi:hypothetical protein